MMHHKLLSKTLTALLVLLAPMLRGQESRPAGGPLKGIWCMPELNGLTAAATAGTSMDIKLKPGFSAGVALQLKITERVSFRTGLGFGMKNYEFVHKDLVFSSDINQLPKPSTKSRIEASASNNEIQLPLIFQFGLKNPRLFLAAGMEMIYGFGFNSDRTVYYGNGAVEKLSERSLDPPWNLATLISFGYIHPFGKANITAEPLFKYCWNPYVFDDIYHPNHQYSYGLKLSLSGGW